MTDRRVIKLRHRDVYHVLDDDMMLCGRDADRWMRFEPCYVGSRDGISEGVRMCANCRRAVWRWMFLDAPDHIREGLRRETNI